MNTEEEIQKLKKEKDAVILAHYYVEDKIQEIADYTGDSFALAKYAETVKNKNIIFCGVKFMGESAKIICPDKNVYLTDESADCPMAHMVTKEEILKVREEHPGVAVVCYINSTAEIKAESDVCVTSSNAVRIIKKLSNKEIYFIPDNNLGRYIQSIVKEKKFIFNDGFCPVHVKISRDNLLKKKSDYPNAKVLAHPECTKDILDLSDFIGSTSEIIEYAAKSDNKEFIVATETGVFFDLKRLNKDKIFMPVQETQICPDMKKNTILKLKEVLENIDKNDNGNKVLLSEDVISRSKNPLIRMLELGKDE